MRKIFGIIATVALAATPAGVVAGASSFTLVNATGVDMSSVSIRRFGAQEWQSLAAAPGAGKAAPVQFSDPDCAFEIRAALAGGQSVVWRGVNLCDAKIVRLNRDASGAVWVDYD